MNGRSPRIVFESRAMTSRLGADVRREIDLVDDQQVRPGDAGAALARNLVAARDVDDVDRRVDQLGAEAGGEVVAAALEKHEIEVGMARASISSSASKFIDASSRIAVCGQPPVWTPMMRSAGERLAADQKLHVLAREDVVGDHAEPVVRRASLAQRVDQRRLAGADRPADPDAAPALRRSERHDREQAASATYCWRHRRQVDDAGVNDSTRRRRRRAIDRASDRSSTGHARRARGQQRVRLGLADRHQPHRRRDGRRQPGVDERFDGARAASTPAACARAGKRDRQRRPDRPRAPSPAAPLEARVAGGASARCVSSRVPSRGSTRRALDEGRSAVSSSSSATSASQSASRNAGHAARPPARRSARASRRGRRRSTRAGRRASATAPDAVAASRPSECANPPTGNRLSQRCSSASSEPSSSCRPLLNADGPGDRSPTGVNGSVARAYTAMRVLLAAPAPRPGRSGQTSARSVIITGWWLLPMW